MSTGPVTDSHQSCITIMRFVLLFAISGFALAQAQFEAATVKLHGAGAGMGMFLRPADSASRTTPCGSFSNPRSTFPRDRSSSRPAGWIPTVSILMREPARPRRSSRS